MLESSAFYRRKLYSLLQQPNSRGFLSDEYRHLACFQGGEDESTTLDELDQWWNSNREGLAAVPGKLAQDIAASSDRVNLQTQATSGVVACHPISGQRQPLTSRLPESLSIDLSAIATEEDAEKVYWWFWRFHPELMAQQQTHPENPSDLLLLPAHPVLPDCPLHSHQSTVSALVGALNNASAEQPEDRVPYLLLFSFSPVQDFIKASRKFLDFWAGSYLLHYLSAQLCWHIAEEYGPDAIIVPSLWGQEIVDAFLLQKYPDFAELMVKLSQDKLTPAKRFDQRLSNSLSTAGFPNQITALVPGKAAAQALGKDLAEKLSETWKAIGYRIRDGVRGAKDTEAGRGIRDRVVEFLTNPDKAKACGEFWTEFASSFPSGYDLSNYEHELKLLSSPSCWEWSHLWEAQLGNTWEPYWAAVPLGNPAQALSVPGEADHPNWQTAQNQIAWPPDALPSSAESAVYTEQLNVGTWWGSLQQRLRTAHQAVKNTRHWQIPSAPGVRSTLSGQFSAIHPRINYQTLQRNGQQKDFREGGGLPESSMRLFWLLMSYAYPGLFNGSEMLNALELTKRMAWQFGGVAESLGIDVEKELKSIRLDQEDTEGLGLVNVSLETDYEKLIRFPNLSSIAAARFMHDACGQSPSPLRAYWKALRSEIQSRFAAEPQQRSAFGARTRGRPTQVTKTDKAINPPAQDGQDYNGVMFSAKWLADEMTLGRSDQADRRQLFSQLRSAVDAAHKRAGFGEGSPGDWWVIVLGDGDGMGDYISGKELLPYSEYLTDTEASHYLSDRAAGFATFEPQFQALLETQKRMGPATHVGLNRALLDFSNRLVPYLTEKRHCGRVIYSGGDDVMAVLPLEDLPSYLRSLRAAWSGGSDPEGEFRSEGGYWHPESASIDVKRPHFTMGNTATMSLGIVIAYKSVPLPTVLESLWDAEKVAKAVPGKDGLCFRVIYGGGNTLEAVMKGELLSDWWALINAIGEQNADRDDSLSPLFYRLADELPRRAAITPNHYLFAEAARAIAQNRDEGRRPDHFSAFCDALVQWLRDWEDWVRSVDPKQIEPGYDPRDTPPLLGTSAEELAYLLRFTAFWIDKMTQRRKWLMPAKQEAISS